MLSTAQEPKKSFFDSIKSKRRPLSSSLSINNIHARYLDKRSSVYFDKENFDDQKSQVLKPLSTNVSATRKPLKARKRLSMVSLRSLKPDTSDSDTESTLDMSPFTPQTANNDQSSINLTSIESADEISGLETSPKRKSNTSISEFVQSPSSRDLESDYILGNDVRLVSQEKSILGSFNCQNSYKAALVENAVIFGFEQAGDSLDLDNIDYSSLLKSDPYTLE